MRVFKLFAAIIVILAMQAPLVGCSRGGGEASKQGAPAPEIDEHAVLMVKQHKTMLDIQAAWQRAKVSAEEGRTGEAIAPSTGIENMASVLEGFMLHKNPDKKEEFLKRAREFKGLAGEFRRSASAGDAAALKKLAPEIDKACEGCHETFR